MSYFFIPSVQFFIPSVSEGSLPALLEIVPAKVARSRDWR
jgi:hypothetical protein